MGAWVDRDVRAREIHVAGLRLIEREGYRDFSLRALADELGGSMTLVTHYFPNHAALMSSLLEYQLEEFDAELVALESGVDDLRRLQILIDWFLPNDDESWASERSRILLLTQVPRDAEWLRPYLDRLEAKMTHLLRDHLRPLIDEAHLDASVDILRMTLSGIVLSAVEYPHVWTPDHQRTVMDEVVHSLAIRGGEAYATRA